LEASEFGRYQLFELIGQGAMGEVYKAHDTVMGRDVAIKILPGERSRVPGFRERFSREALISARLTEPHIIPIHDTGEIDGRLYLVMPIIRGLDVDAALRRDGPMAPARAVRVVEQIAAALDAAHAHGLVHRDVKPSNALMTDHDFVYLIDFGIAQDNSASKLTTASRTVGTWAYMAPERLMSDVADARTDVYALACVLYECLTGDRPFPGELVAQQMTAHLTTPPPRPSERQPGVPVGFDDVVARGMAKDPADRYQSAGDLAVAAAAALATPRRGEAGDSLDPVEVGARVESPRSGAAAFAGLANTLQSGGIGAASFPWPPPSEPDRPPYRGWEQFQPVDAGVFFGRDAELVRAMDALHGMRDSDEALFVVLGASGAGKSCFLRAGIVPRLQRIKRSYLVLDIVRPELRALTGACGLAQAICAARQRVGLHEPPLGDIKDACTRGDAAALRTWLLECRDAGGSPDAAAEREAPTIVLPLDQAEELFTADSGGEAAGFLALIRELALAGDGEDRLPFIVAATIRTDRYEVMQTAPQLSGLQTRQFDLRPMDATQFHSVITGPAQRSTDGGRPLYLDEDLVRRLLADATAGADTLPLLSLTLAWLYRDYGSTGRLTAKPYDERGGIDGVVQAEIHELLASEPGERAEQLHRLRAAFIPWLATVNPDNDQPMRRLARWDDLPADSHPLLERFIERRLLMKDLRDGVVVVEVALESLLRLWEELAGWLAEESEDLKAADALERSAAEWRKKQREDAWLLHGPRLTAAENLAAKPGFCDRLNNVRDYLLASRQHENEQAALEQQRQVAELEAAKKLAAAETQAREQVQESAAALRQRSRILRAVLAGTSVIAVIAVVGAVVAVIMFKEATREARNALAAELDAQAAAVFSGTITDSNIRALTATLAAQRLRSDPAAGLGALYTAATVLNTTRIILSTPAPVATVAMSPDGRVLASGGGDAVVRLWNVSDPAHPRPLGSLGAVGQGAAVASVAFSPDGRLLASGGADGAVRLWDVADPGHAGPLGEPLQGQRAGVASVAFSPGGRVLASGGGDGTVRLWDVADPRHAGLLGAPLLGQGKGIASLAFSPDGHLLATGGSDGRVRMWNLADPARPAPLGEPLSGHTRFVQDLAFSPDGRVLASGGGDGDIQLWDFADPTHPRPLGEPLLGHTGIVQSLAFSPDGHVLASGSDDDTVRLWNVSDPGHAGPLGGPLAGHSGNVPSIAFTPDGRTLASGSQDGNIQLWNLDTALPLQTQAGAVHSVVFSPDGRTLASGNEDATIRLWDVADPVHPLGLGQPLGGHTGAVESVAFSPDGHTLASGGDDGTVRLWDVADVAHPVPSGGPLTGGGAPVRSVAFSRDGHTVASGGDDATIRLWNVADSAHPVPLGGPLTGHSAPVRSVAFSPDGRTLASGGDDATIRLWNVTDHAAPLSQPFRRYMTAVYSVAFSPDGHILASGSGDDTVLLWNVNDPARPSSLGRPLHGNTGYVYQVAFSPDGHTLAAGSADHDVQLWDLDDPAHAHPLGQPLMSDTDSVLSVAFSPDGRSLASGSADATVRLSPTPLDATAKLLCSKLTSNVSHEDWQQWISPKVGYITLCPELPVAQ